MENGLIPPVPGFDDPLEMLRACHGRIEAQCETLLKLREHLLRCGSDVQAQQAAEAVLRYFDTAGKYHHQDEEQDLFPLLIEAAGGEQVEQVLLLVENLLAEHREMEQAWATLRPALAAIAQGREARLDELAMEKFTSRYRIHIAAENTNVIPLAARILGAGQLQALGEKMSARRGVLKKT